jgi:hypothetical protein
MKRGLCTYTKPKARQCIISTNFDNFLAHLKYGLLFGVVILKASHLEIAKVAYAKSQW